MPRGRIISKSISRSKKVAGLSLAGKLLFTWLIPHTDREGRLDADIWAIKSIVPFVNEISPDVIPDLLTSMEKVGLIFYYGDEDHRYLQIRDFETYNTHSKDREAPSSIPEPEQLRTNSGQAPTKLRTQVKVKVKAKVKKREEKKKEITHPPLVSISKEEQKKLLEKYEKSSLLVYVDKLNDYGEQFPKKFKEYASHAAVLRSWMRRDNVSVKGRR